MNVKFKELQREVEWHKTENGEIQIMCEVMKELMEETKSGGEKQSGTNLY